MNWTPVGWQHLYLETPENWSVGAVSGDMTTGYLRLDDAEMPRVEIRWEKSKGNEPVGKVVDRYLDTLVKKTKGKTPPVRVRRDLSLLKREEQQEDRTFEGFHWKTEGDDPVQAYGILWRCQVCARTVFIQVLARVGETILPTASRVLNSLSDHPGGDRALWAVYGMRFETPAQYRLKEHQFLTGRLRLRFSAEGDEVEVERRSLAEMQLEGRTFEEWYRDTGDGEVEKEEILAEDTFPHPGLMTSGLVADPASVNKRLAWLPWRHPRIRRYDRCGWHCPDGNKLYTLRRLAGTEDREQLLQIVRTLVCH